MKHRKTWHGGVHTHFIPQWPCYHVPVLWVVMVVIQSTSWWHLWAKMSIPPPNTCDPAGHSVNKDIPAHYTLSAIFTQLWWTLQLISMGETVLPIDPPQESLPSLMRGDCQTIIYLWHCLAVTLCGSRIDLGGTGTSIPCLVDTYMQGNTSFWCNEKEPVAM